MTNREYLKSCLSSKKHENDFVKFIIAIQIDACAVGKDHYSDIIGNVFPKNSQEWSTWLDEEATISISSINKIMSKLENKGFTI